MHIILRSVLPHKFGVRFTMFLWLTHLIPPVTIVTVKKVFIYKALKTLLTDVLVHFLQIWKKIKGLN